jgi:hypothetical protein
MWCKYQVLYDENNCNSSYCRVEELPTTQSILYIIYGLSGQDEPSKKYPPVDLESR